MFGKVARDLRPRLPAIYVGPQWFAAVMGTGVLATCIERLATFISGLHVFALGLLVLTWGVLAVIGACFVGHALRRPGRLRASISDVDVLPLYGAISMGLLAVGAATLAVAQLHLPTVATVATWTRWWAGMLLGVVTAVAFPIRLLVAGAAGRGAPTPVWVLPVVPPMVAAGCGAVLANMLPPGTAASLLLLGCGVLFALSCLWVSLGFNDY